MAPLCVLIHSPSVGPATWTPVAGELARRRHEALVPSLLTVGAGEPPAWPRVVAAVVDALAAVPPDRPVVLVPHSNAGVFIPVVRRGRRPPGAGAPVGRAGDPAPGGGARGPPGAPLPQPAPPRGVRAARPPRAVCRETGPPRPGGDPGWPRPRRAVGRPSRGAASASPSSPAGSSPPPAKPAGKPAAPM